MFCTALISPPLTFRPAFVKFQYLSRSSCSMKTFLIIIEAYWFPWSSKGTFITFISKKPGIKLVCSSNRRRLEVEYGQYHRVTFLENKCNVQVTYLVQCDDLETDISKCSHLKLIRTSNRYWTGQIRNKEIFSHVKEAATQVKIKYRMEALTILYYLKRDNHFILKIKSG